MRLLNITTKRLETFYGNNIPKYAILSHMWGKEEDEVLFKHIAGSDDDRCKGYSLKGYAKLLGACKQASRDKLKYIWVDTCCIDKQSSAELSEAINSMYTWYRGSEVCYAYLEDVQGDREGDGSVTFNPVPFERSRWFTRGWTLQELIAPQRVVFYSRDWTDIGTKASLRDVISAVTDIRVEMIINYDPDKASVAEKLSWAARRQTTRDEDIAYCLMGLVGVNMPLLYGEGTRAFRRLQEEIMKVSDDHSIFAWKIAYHRYTDRFELLRETRGMLADSPSNFLGAGNVVRSNDEWPYSAYSMSNKGLQIELSIRPINFQEVVGINLADSHNIFKAILDCTYRGINPARQVVIYLKMVGKGRYVRIFPYWLDETRMNPNEDGWVVTPLLVPQVNSVTISVQTVFVKILPTESGYSHKAYNNGSEFRLGGQALVLDRINIFIFHREQKYFGVVFGRDKGLLWTDIITEDDYERELNLTSELDIINKIESLYEKGGSRCHVVLQHPNWLCVNVSKDLSVDISGKPILFGTRYGSEFSIDIRRIKIQVTLPISNFLDRVDPRNVHPNFKKEGIDWFAIFNSKAKRVLDVSSVQSFEDENSLIITLFSPDGKYLATATKSTVRIYNSTTGVIACVWIDKSIQHLYFRCMRFSPNGDSLAVGTHDGRILLWDINKKYVRRDFTGHQSDIKIFTFSPDGRFIVSVPKHGMVCILDIVDGTSEGVFDLGHEELSSAAISPDNRFVAGAHGAVIRIWSLETKVLVEEIQGHDGYVGCIAFTPDGKGLVSGGSDHTLKYWDVGRLVAAGIKQSKGGSGYTEPISNPQDQDVGRSSQCIMNIRHKYGVSNVGVSYDRKWIVSVSAGSVHFWDPRNGTVQFTLENRLDGIVRSFDMSSAGNIFVTYAGLNRVQIWKYDDIEDMEKF